MPVIAAAPGHRHKKKSECALRAASLPGKDLIEKASKTPSKEFRGKSGIAPIADFVMETDWSVGQVVKAIDQIVRYGTCKFSSNGDIDG